MFVPHFCGDQPMSSATATAEIIYVGPDVHEDSVTIAVLPQVATLRKERSVSRQLRQTAQELFVARAGEKTLQLQQLLGASRPQVRQCQRPFEKLEGSLFAQRVTESLQRNRKHRIGRPN